MKNSYFKQGIKVIIAVAFLLIVSSMFFADTGLAATCEDAHPGFGGCVTATSCPSGQNKDSASTCDNSKICCFSASPTNNLELQIPLFNTASVDNLAQYIYLIYQYILIILVPLAIIMIIVGGAEWVLAAGNQQKIGEAQKRITGAAIGLFIGLSSYLILSLVGLTQLKNPQITYIRPVDDTALITQNAGTATATYQSVGGQCFPVASDSFNFISWNWGARRTSETGGGRCHAGIDIYTKGQGQVVALADGTVTSVGHFYSCKGGEVDRVIINHGSYTINYGEINSGAEASGIKNGAHVKAGQVIGVATNCGMLHLELYNGSVSTNSHWYPPGGAAIGNGNYCRDNYMSTKPPELQDPTNTIKNLQGKMCGP